MTLNFTQAGCYPKDSPASVVTKMLWQCRQSSHFVCLREQKVYHISLRHCDYCLCFEILTFSWWILGLFWTFKFVFVVLKLSDFLTSCFICSVARPAISGDQIYIYIYTCSLCDTVFGVSSWELNLSHWTWVWGKRYVCTIIGCGSRAQKYKVCAELGNRDP